MIGAADKGSAIVNTIGRNEALESNGKRTARGFTRSWYISRKTTQVQYEELIDRGFTHREAITSTVKPLRYPVSGIEIRIG